jgi:hypothetical protein
MQQVGYDRMQAMMKDPEVKNPEVTEQHAAQQRERLELQNKLEQKLDGMMERAGAQGKDEENDGEG